MKKPTALQAGEFANLAAEAQAADNAGAPPPPIAPGLIAPGDELPDAPAPIGEADKIEMWAAVPRTFGSLLVMAMPELREVYSDQNCNAWGKAMLPVARKYGWDSEAGFPVELGLCFATFPFLAGTYMAMAKRKGQPRAPGNAAPAAQSTAAPPDVNMIPGP